MTVWIYVDTSKQVGDKDHLKVFDNLHIADRWLEANDPEGVAFEYRHIRIGSANPAVRTRKHEVVSCSVADPHPTPLKIRLQPRKPG